MRALVNRVSSPDFSTRTSEPDRYRGSAAGGVWHVAYVRHVPEGIGVTVQIFIDLDGAEAWLVER
jgi:hypothetical protein